MSIRRYHANKRVLRGGLLIGAFVLSVTGIVSAAETTPQTSPNQSPQTTTGSVPVPENYGQAMRWYESAAKAGNARAQFFLGMLYEQGQRGKPDLKTAVEWFEKAAAQGHRQAQLRLALMYYNGAGVAQNYEQAARWFERAAASNSSQAAYNYAIMLMRGQGVTKDPVRAAKLFEKALSRGIKEAALHLAALYADVVTASDQEPEKKDAEKTGGLKKDNVRALMWLIWAEQKGLKPDPAFRAELIKGMSGADQAKARDLALKRLKN